MKYTEHIFFAEMRAVILAGLSSLLLFSCNKSETLIPLEENLIGFSLHKKTQQTKGLPETDSDELRSTGFGVFAWMYPKGSYFEGTASSVQYIDNARGGYSFTESGTDYWTLTPTTYWPAGQKLSFFAYAPWQNTSGTTLNMPVNDGADVYPRGTYTVPSNVSMQPDFCLAEPVLNRSSSQGSVPLVFNHALTRVLFYMNAHGDVYPGIGRYYKVTSLSIHNVVGSNSFTLGTGENGFTWDRLQRTDLSNRTASYDLSVAGGTLVDSVMPFVWEVESETGFDKYLCLNGTEDGSLYMLPQPMTTAAYVSFVVSAFGSDGMGGYTWIEDLPVATVPLPEITVWQPGRTVAYILSYDSTSYDDLKFSVNISPWTSNTAAYGEFEPQEDRYAMEALFSVSSTTKVRFSKGNLQAVIGTAPDVNGVARPISWRFAPEQYSLSHSESTYTASMAVTETVGLFSWVGEGAEYDSYGLCTVTPKDAAHHGDKIGGAANNGLMRDWGNVASVIDWVGNGWRSLTEDEWDYLLTGRANAGNYWSFATVCGVRGLLILPDSWVKPGTISFSPGAVYYGTNVYTNGESGTANAWCDMEASGAVFLPAEGSREGTLVQNNGTYGRYWTGSTGGDMNKAFALTFSGGLMNPNASATRDKGMCVRLVRVY